MARWDSLILLVVIPQICFKIFWQAYLQILNWYLSSVQILVDETEKSKQYLAEEREKFKREKEDKERIIKAKDEMITTLKETFDSVEALKDFKWKQSSVQKWGESTPVFCIWSFCRHSDKVSSLG